MRQRPRVSSYSEDPEYLPGRRHSALTTARRTVQPSWTSFSTGRRRRQNGSRPNHPSPSTSTSYRGRQNGNGLNHPSPSASTGRQQLNVTGDLHNDDDINVCDSLHRGETNSLPQTTNNLEEERSFTCILPFESQRLDKRLNTNMESQQSPIIRETNNIFSSIEVPSKYSSILSLPLEDGNQVYAHQAIESALNHSKSSEKIDGVETRKDHFQNVTTKEVGLRLANLSLEQIRHAIIIKHGDIAKECTESCHMRTTILNGICDLLKEIGSKNLNELDDKRLHDFDLFSKRAEEMKFNVGWLRVLIGERIAARGLVDEIEKAKYENSVCEQHIKDMENDLQKQKADLEWQKLVIANKELELAYEIRHEQILSNKIGKLTSSCQQLLSKPLIDRLL